MWTVALGRRRHGPDGRTITRPVGDGSSRRPRTMRLAAWLSNLEACCQPRPKGLAHSSPASARRSMDRGSWSVPLEAQMKLPTILSTHPSTKARSQAAGGPFRGDGGPPTADAPKTNGPSNPGPRSLRAPPKGGSRHCAKITVRIELCYV